jgi:hypothetical protein
VQSHTKYSCRRLNSILLSSSAPCLVSCTSRCQSLLASAPAFAQRQARQSPKVQRLKKVWAAPPHFLTPPSGNANRAPTSTSGDNHRIYLVDEVVRRINHVHRCPQLRLPPPLVAAALCYSAPPHKLGPEAATSYGTQAAHIVRLPTCFHGKQRSLSRFLWLAITRSSARLIS